eukprot:773837-Pelagomonas_calceolata.AAC.7
MGPLSWSIASVMQGGKICAAADTDSLYTCVCQAQDYCMAEAMPALHELHFCASRYRATAWLRSSMPCHENNPATDESMHVGCS